MYCTRGGAWGVDVMKVLLGASAVAETAQPQCGQVNRQSPARAAD